MDSSRSDDRKTPESAESATRLDRRKFLGTVAATAGGLLLGDALSSDGAHAQSGQKFTDWGWPQPYDQISPKSKQWLESKGWWPINAGWVVVWSGEEMINNILQQEKLLEKRGIDVYTIWEPHVSYSTEVLKSTHLLETLNPYYIYSGYYYTRMEIEENAPDVAQLMTDAFIEAVLWAKANPDKAVASLMAQPAYG